MSKIIEGIFLRPTEKEASEIWQAVRDFGFEMDGNGVLALILDLLRTESELKESESELKGETPTIVKYFKDNPDHLVKAVNAVSGLFKKR